MDLTYIYFKNANGKGIYKVFSRDNKPLTQKTIIEEFTEKSLQDICDESDIEWFDD